jgi:hypothetical protein
MTGCVCKFSGWCDRHQVKKLDHLHDLCKNDQRYFEAWETGTGPLQKREAKKVKKNRKKGPGTILERKIKEFGYRHSAGCGCQSMVAKMNRWGAKGCREHMQEIVDHLIQAGKKTGWIARLALTLPVADQISRQVIQGIVEQAINESDSSMWTITDGSTNAAAMDPRASRTQRHGDALAIEQQGGATAEDIAGR